MRRHRPAVRVVRWRRLAAVRSLRGHRVAVPDRCPLLDVGETQVTAVDRQHVDWCAEGHRCGLGEHRSHPHVVEVPGAGRVVLTRVQSRDGREHAEIRATVRLSADEPRARWQLARLMTELGRVVRMAAVRKERRGQ
jgi:hypothetical protein